MKKRAELANKFRRSKSVKAGDEAILRDPRQRKAGGRSAYRQPYTEPALVKNVRGFKRTLRTKDGTTMNDTHLEDVMLVPETARNLEKDLLLFEEDNDMTLDSVEELSLIHI